MELVDEYDEEVPDLIANYDEKVVEVASTINENSCDPNSSQTSSTEGIIIANLH